MSGHRQRTRRTSRTVRGLLATLFSGSVVLFFLTNTAPVGATNGTGGYVGTLAGNGTAGFLGDGGLATNDKIDAPTGLAVDSFGDVAIADTTNNRIEFIPASNGAFFGVPMIAGAMYTIAGTGTAGTSANGTADTAAQVNAPDSVTFDSSGNLYIVDTGASCVQAISQFAGTALFGVTLTNANSVYTVAGKCGTAATGAQAGTAATSATLDLPESIGFDPSGNLYVVDSGANCIRGVSQTAGTVLFGVTLTTKNSVYPIVGACTQAGSNTSANGTADASVRMKTPSNVAFDSSGNLYYDDAANHCVLAVSPSASNHLFGVTLTVADAIYDVFGSCTMNGSSASGVAATASKIGSTSWIAMDSSNHLYVDDSANECTRAVSGTGGTSLFGTTLTTADDEYAIAGVCGTSGTTVSGSAATSTDLKTPDGLVVETNLYLADNGQSEVFVVPNSTGSLFNQSFTANQIYAFGGTGTAGYSSTGAQATSAELSAPSDVAVDSSGNIYIADTTNNRIRMVAAANCTSACPWGLPATMAGTIYTIAGNGTAGSSANGTSATSAELDGPTAIAVDSSGNLYIDSSSADCIEVMAPNTTSTLFGVSLTSSDSLYDIGGVCGTSGNGASGTAATAAKLSAPKGIAFDSSGDLYIADTGNGCIRAMSSTGSPTLFGTMLSTTDALYMIVGTCGTVGTASANGTTDLTDKLSGPTSVAFDTNGNLYVDDTSNNCIRATSSTASTTIFGTTLTNADDIYTVVGTCGGSGTSTNGGGDVAATTKFKTPFRIALDASNNLYVTDSGNSCVEATSGSAGTVLFGTTLTSANSIYVIGGTCGTSGSTGDGSLATSAKFSTPDGFALANGNLYLADSGNNRVRVWSSTTSPGLVTYLYPYGIFPTLTLSGVDQTDMAYISAHVVPDPHWSLQITATSLSTGVKTFPTPLTVASESWSCDNGATCMTPVNGVSYPLTLTPGTATNFFTDSGGAGIGTLTFGLDLAVPADIYAGTYSGTWTISSNAGP